MRISVIIPAYNADKYIEECLDSVKAQTYKDIDIFVGIDHCEKTLSVIKNIRYKYKNLSCFWFPQNVGPYIVMNSLAMYQKNNVVCFFGADDIMKPFLVQSGMSVLTKYDLIRFKCKNFFPNGSTKQGPVAQGSFFIKNSLFKKLCGFRPFKVGADTDFRIRAKELLSYSFKDKVYFLRRKHSESLTEAKDTGGNSLFRKKCHADMEKMRGKDIPITICYFEEIL